MAHIHPDNTALRAVDACGGIYSPSEEASGFAEGHRAAMQAALLASFPVDNLMSDLFDALVDVTEVLGETAMPDCPTMKRALDAHAKAIAAIAKAEKP